MMMWPFRGLEGNRAPCDLSFMEAINQRMQVPSRLQVVHESNPLEKERKAEELRPSFRMHIPDRLSLAEMMDDSQRPLLLNQLRQHPSIVHTPQDPSTQPTGFGELLFLDTTTQTGTQKRKRSTHHGRLWKERSPSETPQMALRCTSQKPDRSQDAGPASESSLEEVGVTDIIAMRKQLNKISGRLRTLEEQCTGWRQKELLVYSVLVSACLINTWLWLRR
ncbi:fetal and adult testis-expressed transcript protein homolog isoform X2 [Dermochelys coriacea]|uniref:fetal and adult testis-expressed transcript protein homolog isoform X2 n=1 Tax=Dermochelys coriacea TaxID=27794 RepID=UPI001CA91249|nr:fetal and adult testis-expressed transcript protein homolog isoform X2 [Dermochelys coriacea]XP_043348212.1 fetal and adult testis-expressed transcript protein homolog isoform X2 [Dermochelys coriacea]